MCVRVDKAWEDDLAISRYRLCRGVLAFEELGGRSLYDSSLINGDSSLVDYSKVVFLRPLDCNCLIGIVDE